MARFGEEYRTYRSRVPMFFPRPLAPPLQPESAQSCQPPLTPSLTPANRVVERF